MAMTCGAIFCQPRRLRPAAARNALAWLVPPSAVRDDSQQGAGARRSEAADQAALQSATTEPGVTAAHNVVLCIDATEDIAWHIF
jgi:hypothetical protein